MSDSREKASASTSPAFSAATAASVLSKETWVALGAVLLEVRKVAVLATPPMRTPAELAAATEAILPAGPTR